MKPSIQTLGQILYSPSQYIIPVFQRNYRWEAPEWGKLWESLIEIQSAEKRGNHFMGFLVFVPGLAQPGQNTTFHLIDGQQRLTTTSILLAAIRNVARGRQQDELANEVHHYYLTHPLKKGDQHCRLLPKERDHDSYLALVSGKEEPTGRMGDAVAYFEERIAEWAGDSPELLRQLFDTVCQRLEFMCATLEAENAYNIFKSLNSTGVPLGPSDLIRNFVFMHVPPDEHDAFDRELWAPLEEKFPREDGTLDEERFSKFFRDFLMSSGRYIAPKDTFVSFEARYEATGFSPKELARSLARNAERYAVISGAEEDVSDDVTRALGGLNALESSTTYPLLLSLFEQRVQGRIDSGQLARAVEMLRGFILRRFVAGETSRGYGQMFLRAIGAGGDAPVVSLEAYLLDRGWPDDRRFEEAFVRFPLYQRGYTRQVLETLERAYGHKEPASLDSAQVEHILPQTLSAAWRDALGPDADRVHAEWLHRPGNLTLSGYNLALWNHPFEVKSAEYAKSNFVLTRDLASYAAWTEAEIVQRGRKLAAEASRIWIGPKEPPRRQEPQGGQDEGSRRQELRRRFWEGLAEYLTTEHPDVPGLKVTSQASVRMPSAVRHIGVETRFALQQGQVGVDVWFWREASMPVWRRIRAEPSMYDALIDCAWQFEQRDGQDRARMHVTRAVTDLRDESRWPDAYQWMGETLVIVFERVAPMLRAEMDRIEASV